MSHDSARAERFSRPPKKVIYAAESEEFMALEATPVAVSRIRAGSTERCMEMKRATVCLLAVSVLSGSTGCSKVMALVRGLTGGGDSSNNTTPTNGSAPAPEGPASPESSVETPAPSRATGCPATTANSALLPGTVHKTELQRDETWDLAGSPHRLPHGFRVLDGKTLTVEPCAVVLVGAGSGLTVENGGALVAAGDAEHPIRFGSNNPQPQAGDWNGLWFAESVRRASRLSHVVIEHGGHDWSGGHAGLAVTFPGLHVDHLTARANLGFGVALRDGGRFAPGSSDVTVTGTTSEGASLSGAVYVQRAPSVASLPAGRYTGNAVDEVFIAEAGPGSDTHTLRNTATWANLGVPYHIADDLDVRVDGPTGPILTIAAGVTLLMGRNAGISVGYDAEGGLVIDGGSDDGRVTLKPAGNDASPGQWHGVYFGPRFNRSASRLRYVTIQSAGSPWGSSQFCDWAGDNSDSGFVAVEAAPQPSLIDHARFVNGGPDTAAIVRHWRGAPVNFADPSLGNDFAAFNAPCHQSPTMNADGSCPDPAPACQ